MRLGDDQLILFNPFGEDESEVECRRVRIVTTRAMHRCSGMPGVSEPHDIPSGTRARFEKALIDKTWWGEYYLCVECIERYAVLEPDAFFYMAPSPQHEEQETNSALYSRREAVSEWQPRDAAPKDGRAFLSLNRDQGDLYCVTWFHRPHGYFVGTGEQCLYQFTHWMPLPTPPSKEEDAAAT